MLKPWTYIHSNKKKYKNWTARKEQKCNCVEMVDISVYNSCTHFCKYCYANVNEEKIKEELIISCSSFLISLSMLTYWTHF